MFANYIVRASASYIRKGGIMPFEKSPLCTSCRSDNLKDFDSEMALRFPGLPGLEKPIVWMFPKVALCFSCGLLQAVVALNQVSVKTTIRRPLGNSSALSVNREIAVRTLRIAGRAQARHLHRTVLAPNSTIMRRRQHGNLTSASFYALRSGSSAP